MITQRHRPLARNDSVEEALALGFLASLPFNWFARQIVEQHVTVEFMNSAPVPRSRLDHPKGRRVIEIAGTLAATDMRYQDWAACVGVPVAAVANKDAANDLTAELDAIVALLYGLDRDDIEYVFANFHQGWAYEEQLAKVLVHFDRWAAQVQ